MKIVPVSNTMEVAYCTRFRIETATAVYDVREGRNGVLEVMVVDRQLAIVPTSGNTAELMAVPFDKNWQAINGHASS